MKTKLQNVLRYFDYFGYIPSFEEIHTFFPVKISKIRLKSYLNSTYKHTLGGYGIGSKVEGRKSKVALNKIARAQKYINFISRFPQIRLIGLSGSVAMLNAKKNDDVDLFIISTGNRLWTARFIANMAAWLYGLKRKRGASVAQDKVCLNLFFSESSLKIDKKLQTEYMAHEVLQMIPIMDKNQTYRRFLYENDWISRIFPNVHLKRYFPDSASYVSCRSQQENSFSLGVIGNGLERLFKVLQLFYMSKPKGDERIENGKLWFHPRDYSRIVGK